MAHLLARPASEPLLKTLRSLVTDLMPVAVDESLVLRRSRLIMKTPALSSRFRQRQETTVQQFVQLLAMHGGVPSNDIELEVVVRALFEAIYVAVHRWQASNGARSVTELAAEAVTALGKM